MQHLRNNYEPQVLAALNLLGEKIEKPQLLKVKAEEPIGKAARPHDQRKRPDRHRNRSRIR